MQTYKMFYYRTKYCFDLELINWGQYNSRLLKKSTIQTLNSNFMFNRLVLKKLKLELEFESRVKS